MTDDKGKFGKPYFNASFPLDLDFLSMSHSNDKFRSES
jgi:phosphopantetheinyl transferase